MVNYGYVVRRLGESVMSEKMFYFIEEHWLELVNYIRSTTPNAHVDTQDDIEEWINNDEDLYNWAEREGVFD